MWRNTVNGYGWVSIALHWLVAAVVIGMFGLGLWMTDLEYYHAWYKRGPDLHKSIGILVFVVVAARLVWRYTNPHPAMHGKPWERRTAAATHVLLYVLMIALMISGYLISTADGRGIGVFGLLEVPATLTGKHQEDIAGLVHEILAWSLIALAALHALAALKHHIVDRDNTLKRMVRAGR